MGYAAAFGVLAGAMMIFPSQAAEAALDALGLWAQNVAPALGPFMVCMLMVTGRAGGGPGLRCALGWLSGSPGGARLMQPLGLRGREAMRFAALTGTMSPMFFLGTVSVWLGSRRLGAVIFLCHLAGAALLGLCFGRRTGDFPGEKTPMPLSTALREGAMALLTVAGCMMLGGVAARMVSCAFPRLPPLATAALQCALEVTGGVKALIALEGENAASFLCAACSFGGLSLLLQNAAFWQDSGVSLPALLFLRLAHGLLSFLLCAAALAMMG